MQPELHLFSSKGLQHNEAEVFNEFASLPFVYFHCYKPELSLEEIQSWLKLFNSKMLAKMVMHYHLELAIKFNLRGFHITKGQHKELALKTNAFKGALSCSYSDSLSPEIRSQVEHLIVSPLFSKNSKHKSPVAGESIQTFGSSHKSLKLIGLGGINGGNFKEALKLTPGGIALHGALWINLAENKDRINLIEQICRQMC